MLEAAARAHIPVILLDRPNPINGVDIQGPVADTTSYTAYMPLPVRHSLTLGELARYFNTENHINAALTVIPMQGWHRSYWIDQTSIPWTNPSPNLTSLTAATLYPGVALLETANVSVGRGTSTPFELVGAPFIGTHGSTDAASLAAYLTARHIPGVSFAATTFTASNDVGAHYPCTTACSGVRITVTDRNALDAPELGIELISALHHLYPRDFALDKTSTLIANADTMAALRRGYNPRAIAHTWQAALAAFKLRAQPYLLYPR